MTSGRTLPATRCLALAAVLALALACHGAAPTSSGEVPQRVRGRIMEVVSRSITEVDILSIRDQHDKTWNFKSEVGFIGFTPSHLREHQLLGETVVVTYVRRGDTLFAVDISD